MTKLMFKALPFLLLPVLLIGTFSCTEDGGVTTPGQPLGPSISFLSEPGALTSAASVAGNQAFRVKLDLVAGDNPLKSLRITENGANVSASRLTFDNGSTTAQNPILIVGNSTNAVEFIVDIVAHSSGTSTYAFTVSDDENTTSQISIDITAYSGPLAVSLVNEAPYLAGDTELDSTGVFSVKLSASRGNEAIESLSILQDNALITDLGRITFNGGAFSANPLTLSSLDRNGFEAIIDIQAQQSGAARYKFVILGDGGSRDSVSLTIIVGTPIDSTTTAILVNNKDGKNFGGLDLDVPENVAYNSSSAELRDLGIDLNLPLASNWIQKIRAVNGASLVVVNTMAIEGFDFAAINTKELIKEIYEANAPGVMDTPNKVTKGTVLAVKRGNDYFLLLVTNVMVTASDNNDYYELTIKQAFDVN